MASSSNWIAILSVFLVLLFVLLVYLYKKLNQQADGQYTIRHMVYKEGGIRDQVRGVALEVGTRLRIQLWHNSNSDKSGEEMQEIYDEEQDMERGGSEERQGEKEEEEEEGKEEQCSDTVSRDSGTSADDSGSEGGEDARLMGQPVEAGVMEETVQRERGEEENGDASGSAELAIDLKQFSGSAIWSEEQTAEVNSVSKL